MAAKVTASKAAAKRTPQSPPVRRTAPSSGTGAVDGVELVDGIEVLRVGPDVEEPPEERIPLFYIDDREFTVLANPSASIGLEALHIIAQGGGTEVAQAMAVDYVLTEMLGPEAYAVFRRSKQLSVAQRQWVVEKCQALAMGSVEAPKP